MVFFRLMALGPPFSPNAHYQCSLNETTFFQSFIWNHSKLCFTVCFASHDVPSMRQNDTSTPQRTPCLCLVVLHLLHHPSFPLVTPQTLLLTTCRSPLHTSMCCLNSRHSNVTHNVHPTTLLPCRHTGLSPSFLFSLPPLSSHSASSVLVLLALDLT